MKRWNPPIVAGAAALALLAGLSAPWAIAEEDLDHEEESWVEHAECTMFGSAREDFLTVGLGAQLMKMQRQSELNQAVAAATAGTRRAPSRSRTSAIMAAVDDVPSGPLTGESIDDFIFGQLERKGIAPAAKTTDLEFLRRVSLDLAGRIPTAQEVVEYLNDNSADKRRRTIDRLLASPEWASRWTLFFGDMTGNTQRTAQVNRYPGGRDALHLYIRESMQSNTPYDQFVAGLLSSYGPNDGRNWPDHNSRQSPFGSFAEYQNFLRAEPVRASGASYLVGGRTTGGPIQDTYDTLAAFVARDFLGISHMDCILCHDGYGHLDSLSVWGMDAKRSEGWGLAAFFQRVDLRRTRYRVPPRTAQQRQGPRPPYWYVELLGPGQRGTRRSGAYQVNTTGGNRPVRDAADNGGVEFATPRYPFGGGTPNFREGYGAALARLLTADRQFARNVVNRIWSVFFSRGIVEPFNQFDIARLDPASPPPDPWTIQPSHPELLEFMTDGFIENGFDLQWLMREIVSSEAYQLSSEYDGAWSPSYEQYFARHPVRRLIAEEALDAVADATGVAMIFNQTPAIGRTFRAIELHDIINAPIVRRNRAETGLANSFLDAYFRGDREETTRSADISILQALNMMNNELVLSRISASASQGTLANLLNEDDDTLVGVLYVTVLGRLATPEERQAGVEHLRSGDRIEKAKDLLWALINSVEFVFNR